tara:strand:+ start:1082 stop:1321 length:240 start_codon:yes stop_codon:yes gene_type:complete
MNNGYEFNKDKYNWKNQNIDKRLETNGGCGRILFLFLAILVVIQTFYHLLYNTLSIAQSQLCVLILGFYLILIRIGERR